MQRRTFLTAAATGIVAAKLTTVAQGCDTPMAMHERYMRMAIAEGEKNPIYPFGAVIVETESGDVLARGVNTTSKHPVFHGEMVAINDYLDKHGNSGWSKLTLYTTGEPCAMCAGAIVWAGIPRLVYASSVPTLAKLMTQIEIRAESVFAASPFYKNELLLGGVLEREADEMFLKGRDRRSTPAP